MLKATEITERKLLEEQLRLKNYALDNSSIAIGLSNLDGTIFYINNAFADLYGYSNKSDIIGKHIYEFSAKSKPSGEELLNFLKDKKTFFGDAKLTREDGSTFICIVSAKLVEYEEKPVCIMAVFTDITEYSEMEAKLREQSAKLSKLNKDKDKLFTIISHDLKSPFSGMLGLLKIIANKYDDYSDEERLKIIQSSYYSAQNAFNLLSDLLEWAKLQYEQFEVKKETLNLSEIVNESIELYKINATEKDIIIRNKINTSISIITDRNSIYSVVRNILNNAIKFTKNGGFVEFSVKESNYDIELSIKDNGVGMGQETIKKLFRIDESITMQGTSNEKGTGLGLTICNELVTKNNWEMNVESQLGKGTTFKILIPK